MPIKTSIPTTTSPMRMTPSPRQPDLNTGRPNVTPRSIVPVPSTVGSASPKGTIRTNGGGPMFDTTSLEVQDMGITAPEQDIYYGVYPDFQLPLPNRPCISDHFVGNTQLVSDTNSPISILQIPSLKKMYGMTEFAIDRNMGYQMRK